uniref:Family 2 glycosyl transferase n=1 Tax=Oscillatoriales cyanobacterium SpSt-402 TaxID=2282168 RepID=A0A832H0P4_9CYAN
MTWQICIRYPNGQEKAICAYKSRETALKRIDAIYSQGYPMHVAYIVRQIETPDELNETSLACLQFG